MGGFASWKLCETAFGIPIACGTTFQVLLVLIVSQLLTELICVQLFECNVLKPVPEPPSGTRTRPVEGLWNRKMDAVLIGGPGHVDAKH